MKTEKPKRLKKGLRNGKGIDCSGYGARHIRKDEYRDFDYIIGMDAENMRDLHYEFGEDRDNKIYRLNIVLVEPQIPQNTGNISPLIVC